MLTMEDSLENTAQKIKNLSAQVENMYLVSWNVRFRSQHEADKWRIRSTELQVIVVWGKNEKRKTKT